MGSGIQMGRWPAMAGWWALGLVWLLGLAACRHEPPETRLRERVSDMQAALEAREPARFIDGVAEDFSSDQGLDRQGLRNLLRVQLLRNAQVGVTLGPLDVVMQGDRATVTFTAVATGGQGGWLPDSARPWRVRSGWRDGPDGWQLIHATWEPAL